MNQPIVPHNLKQPRVYGFIYVLSNMHMPDIYKVGMTTKAPHARAAELSATTGVPMVLIEKSFRTFVSEIEGKA